MDVLWFVTKRIKRTWTWKDQNLMKLLCDKGFPGEMLHSSTHPRYGAHGRLKFHSTEVQLGGPLNFIGVPYRNIGERFLTIAETTHTQLQCLPQHDLTAHKIWEPGAHHTACRQRHKLKGVLPKWLWQLLDVCPHRPLGCKCNSRQGNDPHEVRRKFSTDWLSWAGSNFWTPTPDNLI